MSQKSNFQEYATIFQAIEQQANLQEVNLEGLYKVDISHRGYQEKTNLVYVLQENLTRLQNYGRSVPLGPKAYQVTRAV